MKNLGIVAIVVCSALAVSACGGSDESASKKAALKNRIFVADEDSGDVSVVEEGSNKLIGAIALPDDGAMYMPHNVQVAPDGQSVWVSAPPMSTGDDKVFVIDPSNNQVTASIDLGTELHVAHVVFDPTSSHAYVTANEASRVIEIDAQQHTVTRSFDLGANRGPHGERWCGDRLYVANMTGKSLGIIDVATGTVSEVDLQGVAVQTACTPDGRYVFVSLYDTKEVVRYAIDGGQITRIALPAESQGPVQLYPSPDSKWLWVCDQGMLQNRPASNKLYQIDIAAGTVAGNVQVGNGAHGVVVSEDGKLAYVTNVADNTVSVVDTGMLMTMATVPVGTKPNGVSHWHVSGGMP